MSATAGHAEGTRTQADRLGVEPGAVVLEIGYDEDSDEALRTAVIDRAGADFIGQDSDEVVDVVLLWWREGGDDDLVDDLMDAIGPLADSGVVWLLTPKVGRPGHVEPSDINEAAPTAGLQQTTSISAGRDWSGTRLVVPKSDRSRR
ncbi:MAG: DUF3052 domain-containing protein [Actinomycetota bacterium]|nr:DUF3052 domain-containing protein [Actinomycetota bacterium]